MGLSSLFARFKSQYDKLLAILVLLGLLGSLLYLAANVGLMKGIEKEAKDRIHNLKPAHERAEPANTLPFEQALGALRKPVQLPAWTNAMVFVPETRVWCVDCKQPIPLLAQKCPFCGKDQPVPKTERLDRDLDRDGMLDVWELAHHLNPHDASDAQRDNDNDGFTNYEEFLAGTDPNDPASHPDLVVKLRVSEIRTLRLNLRFDGKIVFTNNDYKFQVNYMQAGIARSDFPRIGQTVAKTGFVVEKFEEIFETVKDSVGVHKVDKSVLTLVRDNKRVPLVFKQETPYVEHHAKLYLDVAQPQEFDLGMGGVIDLQGQKYEVIGIDSREQSVVVKRASDGKQFKVTRAVQGPEAGTR